MKKELSSLDIHYLIGELKQLVGAKIDKIYQPKKDEFLFQLHVAGIGRRIIRIIPGSLLYLTKHKTPSPKKPFGYCAYLRKYLSNARLVGIRQMEFERIIEMIFQTRDAKYKFYIELFTKGNLLLCDDERIIMSPWETQIWKDRELKKGKKYIYPNRDNDFLTITGDQLSQAIRSSDKDSVVKSFAIDIGLGGAYAEELCMIAGIDKRKKPGELAEDELKCLYKAVDKMRNMPSSPRIIYEKGSIKDIVPFEMMLYKEMESKTFKTFNEALDQVFTTVIISKEKEQRRKHEDKDITKAENILKAQAKQLSNMKKDAEEAQRKGEFIFENYQIVEEILNEIKKAREKYSWKDIKEKLKGHKVIKDIIEKEGKIIIEL